MHPFRVVPVPAAPAAKVGISRSVRDGQFPFNGLRHQLEEGTTGWFIWAGEELSTDPDFFVPLHVHRGAVDAALAAQLPEHLADAVDPVAARSSPGTWCVERPPCDPVVAV